MTAARAVWLGVGIGAVVDLLALGLSVFVAAAGHGSYLPAVVLFCSFRPMAR